MIYLATPYTATDLATRNWRYNRAKDALFTLWDQHYPAVCPIVLGHEYEQRQRGGPRELPHDLWMVMAQVQLVACTQVWVLTLPGWDQSKGVRDEVRLAHSLGKGVQGYAPFAQCEDYSGLEVLRTFGLVPRRPVPLKMPHIEEDEE